MLNVRAQFEIEAGLMKQCFDRGSRIDETIFCSSDERSLY